MLSYTPYIYVDMCCISAEVRTSIGSYPNTLCTTQEDDDNVVAEYLIQAECAREMKLQTSKINNCLKGKRKTHGGFRFKYK